MMTSNINVKLVKSRVIAAVSLALCAAFTISQQAVMHSLGESYWAYILFLVLLIAAAMYLGRGYLIIGLSTFSGVALLSEWKQTTVQLDPLPINLVILISSLSLAIGYWLYKAKFNTIEAGQPDGELGIDDVSSLIPHALLASSLGIAIATSHGKFLVSNHAFHQLLGFEYADFQALTIVDILNPRDLSRYHQLTNSLIERALDNIDTEIRFINRQGQDVLTQLTATRFAGDSTAHILLQVRDITKTNLLLNQLRHQSQYHYLTNLLNRQYFMALAKQEFIRSVRYGHSISLAVLGVDSLTQIKEKYGDGIGNEVLSNIATKSMASLRQVDVIGHLTEDEFAIVLSETAIEEAFNVLERLQEKLLEIELPDQHSIRQRVTVSIGLTTYSPNDLQVEDLISRSEISMHEAKNQARNLIKIA